MITYHEGCLGVSPNLLLRLKGSVIPKALIWAVPSSTAAVALFFYWGGVDQEASNSVSQAWTGYSFVLGFLIVYRMQMAYNRYWEACTITNVMRGEWLDAYMSLCSFCSTDQEKREQVMEFKGLSMRLFSMLHQSALAKLCMMEASALPIIDPSGIEPVALSQCMDHKNKMEVLVVWIEQSIIDASSSGVIPVAAPILTRVFNELSNGMVGYQDVTKIRNYMVPFPIVQVIQYLIIFHAMVSPIIASLIMYNWRWAAMLSFSSVFSFWCINYIAMEIEQPFGDHFNNLPVVEMQKDFNRALILSTNKFLWRPPVFHHDIAGRFSQGATQLSFEQIIAKMESSSSASELEEEALAVAAKGDEAEDVEPDSLDEQVFKTRVTSC